MRLPPTIDRRGSEVEFKLRLLDIISIYIRYISGLPVERAIWRPSKHMHKLMRSYPILTTATALMPSWINLDLKRNGLLFRRFMIIIHFNIYTYIQSPFAYTLIFFFSQPHVSSAHSRHLLWNSYYNIIADECSAFQSCFHMKAKKKLN